MADMAVNSTNDNTTAYTAGAAAGGAAAGGAAGYLIKHYLKNGELSDKFIKTAIKRFSNEIDADFQSNADRIKNVFQHFIETITNVVKRSPNYNPHEPIRKELFLGLSAGQFINREVLEKSFEKLQTMGDALHYLEHDFVDAQLKSLHAHGLIQGFWDSLSKQFVDCEDGLGKNIKDLANRTQLKAAWIYAAAAAAVLGVGTYLLTSSKKADVPTSQPDENITSATHPVNNEKLDALKKTMAQSTTKTDTK